jgi:DNA (cytosine-5)-methyltransferase 1
VKPPYKVKTMKEINSLEPNGFSVVSTFSGGGGSSTGYKMANFKVLLANEFIPSAQETYKENHPLTIVDKRDIREVTAKSILEHINKKEGELDIFDGSPPCASFSTAGKREKGWGKEKSYSDSSQVTDDLFFEFARLLKGIQPKTFVAENVSGLVKGTAKGYFKIILDELKRCGYKVSARLLNSAWLGVPQSRERLIFIGVRDDLNKAPIFPKPLPYSYSLEDAFLGLNNIVENESWMTSHATGREWQKLSVGEQSKKYFQLVRCSPKNPVGTITASGGNAGLASISHPYECRKFSIAEVKRLSSFPDDYIFRGSYQQQYERMGRSVPPVMMSHIAKTIQTEILEKI